MKDVMIDLETLGTGYRAAIVAIGAVEFVSGEYRLGREFYRTISLVSSVGAGLRTDPDTVIWWLGQGDAARREIIDAKGDVHDVLTEFAHWLPVASRIWGNGSDFDNRILREAYDCLGIVCPWHYRNDRDMRTYMSLYPRVRLARTGTLHHALDDAKHQVACMAAAQVTR